MQREPAPRPGRSRPCPRTYLLSGTRGGRKGNASSYLANAGRSHGCGRRRQPLPASFVVSPSGPASAPPPPAAPPRRRGPPRPAVGGLRCAPAPPPAGGVGFPPPPPPPAFPSTV